MNYHIFMSAYILILFMLEESCNFGGGINILKEKQREKHFWRLMFREIVVSVIFNFIVAKRTDFIHSIDTFAST